MDGGSIDIDGVSFNPVSTLTTTSSLIRGTSNNKGISVNNVQISNLAVSGGDGVVLNAEMSDGISISVKGCTFSSCSVLQSGSDDNIVGGRGGVMWLNLDLYSITDFIVSTFSSCCGYKGNNYYMIYSDLNTISNRVNGNIVNNSFSLTDAIGCINDSYENEIPLVLYIRDTLNQLQVSNNGIDNEVCGHNDYHCLTLGQAFANKAGVAKDILVNGSSTVNISYDLDDTSYSISKTTEDGIININNGAFITNVNSIFTSLNFNIISISKEAFKTTSK